MRTVRPKTTWPFGGSRHTIQLMETGQSQAPAGSRRGIRRAVSLGCEVISTRNDEPIRYQATDLSAAGLWLQTAEPVRAGETVVVCFRPDDGLTRELLVFASVARVMTARGATDETPGVGMGLELLDLQASELERIERWLAGRRMPVPRRRRPVARTTPLPEPVELSLALPVEVSLGVPVELSLALPMGLPSCWR